MISKTQTTKAKINKWDYIKLKNLRTTKEKKNQRERQHMEWEKISANHISDKRLIPRCKRNSCNSIEKNIYDFKMGKETV